MMPRAMLWALLVPLLSPAISASTLVPNIDITRWNWARALKVGSFLYIDGGEIVESTNNSYAPTFTTAIDLRHDWNISNITGTLIPKPPSYTLSRKQLTFSNTNQDSIYTWGGWPFWGLRGSTAPLSPGFITPDGNKTDDQSYPPDFDFNAADQALWTLRLDGNGNGTWSPTTKLLTSDSGVKVSLGSTVVKSKDTFYTIGGENVRAQPPKTGSTPLTGFYSTSRDNPTTWAYNSGTGWDLSSPGNSTFVLFGEGIYTDLFGASGAIIMFGGYSPKSPQVNQIQSSEGASLWDMSSIAIYDIAADKWMTQRASGQIPQARWGFCAVPISDAANNTVDIFIHGGAVTSPKATGIEPDFSYIYVLTLPSFVWTRIENSNSADPDGRSNPSCAVIGNSQMAVVGGASLALQPSPRDPFPNAVGVFDMNSLSWTDTYKAAAGPYTRNPTLSKVTEATPLPQTWSSADTQAFITQSSDPNSGSGGGSNTGAIAGGVVGGVVGAALIIAAAWYFYRRSRRRQEQPKLLTSHDDLEKPAASPASGDLVTPPTELDTRVPNLELSGADARLELPVVEPSVEMDNNLSMEGKVRHNSPQRPVVHELES